MACLAEVFEQENALDKLEAFAFLNDPAFRRLPPNEAWIALTRQGEPAVFPARVSVGSDCVTVFDPALQVHWTVATEARLG